MADNSSATIAPPRETRRHEPAGFCVMPGRCATVAVPVRLGVARPSNSEEHRSCLPTGQTRPPSSFPYSQHRYHAVLTAQRPGPSPTSTTRSRAGHWWDVIAPVRELSPHKQEKDESGKRKSTLAQQYSDLKDQTLPYAVFSGTWDPRHRHADGFNCKAKECPGNGLLQPSGLRLLDLDDLHDGEAAWIFAAVDDGTLPWAAAAWTSTGGDGIHIVAWLDPAPTNQATSHAAYAMLARDLAINLPRHRDRQRHQQSKNLMRPAFVSADSTARLREDATHRSGG